MKNYHNKEKSVARDGKASKQTNPQPSIPQCVEWMKTDCICCHYSSIKNIQLDSSDYAEKWDFNVTCKIYMKNTYVVPCLALCSSQRVATDTVVRSWKLIYDMKVYIYKFMRHISFTYNHNIRNMTYVDTLYR